MSRITLKSGRHRLPGWRRDQGPKPLVRILSEATIEAEQAWITAYLEALESATKEDF